MSIKSTQRISRQSALCLRADFEERIATLKGYSLHWSDEELGDLLDELAEELCELEGVPCFDNYLVEN